MPRVGNHTGLPCRAFLPIAALNVSGCKLAQTASVAGLPRSGPGAERHRRRSRAGSSPRRPAPSLRPRPRGPGPPLMPAMAVTSLLAPRPGRWPGDPRRAAAAAARQHPEVHPAALPPAARAGAWGRVRPGRAGPGRAGVLPSAAEGGQLGTCGAAPARSPRGLEKRACGAREDAGDVFAGSPHFLPREPISPPTTQSVTREMGGLCFSPWVPNTDPMRSPPPPQGVNES